MPKRAKSPEPVEDSKFFSVVHPYPLNANMEVVQDFKECMRWLACIVGQDYAVGIHYKPSARGMLIAEVSKKFENFDALLGEHQWSRFLNKPASEEKDKSTKVYYSIYSNARAAQKDGWKYLHAEDEVFMGWHFKNKRIVYPYPSTLWCDLPFEDVTNKSMCRPLPVATKLPPSRPPPAPVPGSNAWLQAKAGVNIDSPPAQSKQGGNKGKGKSSVDPNAWSTPIVSPKPKSPNTIHTPPAPAPISPPISPPSTSAWGRPMVPVTQTTSAFASSEPPDLSAPPGITRGRSYGPPPGITRPTNPTGSSSIHALQNQFAQVSVSTKAPSSISSVLAAVSDEEYDDSDDDFEEPHVARIIRVQDQQPVKVIENLWNDPKSPIPIRQRAFRKVREGELCPTHGAVCSKGICPFAKKVDREKKRLAEIEERKKKMKEKAAKQARRKKGKKERSSDDDDDDDNEDEEEDEEEKEKEKDKDDESDNESEEVRKNKSKEDKSLVDEDSEDTEVEDVRSVDGERGSDNGGGDWVQPSKPKKIQKRTGEWGAKKGRDAKKRGARSEATDTMSVKSNFDHNPNSPRTKQQQQQQQQPWRSPIPSRPMSTTGSSVSSKTQQPPSKAKAQVQVQDQGKGKGKGKARKTWDDIVNEDDGSDLGSVMDFGGGRKNH